MILFPSEHQVGFLRIPAVRQFFKIEKAIIYSPETLPIKPKPFVQGFKDCKFDDLGGIFMFALY